MRNKPPDYDRRFRDATVMITAYPSARIELAMAIRNLATYLEAAISSDDPKAVLPALRSFIDGVNIYMDAVEALESDGARLG